jgi:hypothetical protein
MRGKRTDSNHQAIREALRRKGWEVTDLSAMGGGMPDLLAVRHRSLDDVCAFTRARFIEIKNGALSPSRRQLTPAQITLHAAFAKAGIPVCIVSSVAEAEAL